MSTETNQLKGVAIIGMAGRFPGANNVDEFWQNLCQGVESISFFSDEEVLGTGVDPRLLAHPDYVKAWGVLDHEDLFDANFFGIPGREAEAMDPQHRHFMEICVHTLENAGYNSETYDGLIGLICGVGLSTYLLRNLSPNAERLQALGEYLTFIGNDKDFMGTRVAYKLNLRGGAHSVSTACSTTMVAIHLACRQLLAYESDMAIAGGANIKLPQKSGYLYRKGHLKSIDGRCHAFDERASGTVFGCGVAAVLLKRAQEAFEDGDHIYGIIRSSAINNDGNSKAGYTAPSVVGQTEVIAQAHELAGFDPETISHMEAHGTGTELGDPCEVKALTKVFRRDGGTKNQYCALTSVKTNIGHLDNVGGVAGLIKLSLSMKHKLIPPSLNFERPNPEIDFANSPFYVNTELREWKRIGDLPLRACISAFGAGGTNAHAVLEEAPELPASDKVGAFELLTLSAKTSTALAVMTANLHKHLTQNPDLNLGDVAFTQNSGRMNHLHRRALVFASRDELLAKLADPDGATHCYTAMVSAEGEAAKDQVAEVVKSLAAELNAKALFDKLDRLAQDWVSGAFIDWYDYYEGRYFHRIPLPNYPFESVRYWIDQPSGLAVASEEIGGHSQLGPHPMAKKPVDQWFYEASWQRATLSGPKLYEENTRCIVVLVDPCGLGDAMVKRLRESGKEVVMITADTAFEKFSDHHYQIDARNGNHYNGVLTEMQNLGRLPAAVINCWPVCEASQDDEAEVLGFYSMIYLAQAIVAQAYGYEIQLLAVSNRVHDVMGGEEIQPAKTTMLAPIRVIPQEHPEIYCRAVDVVLASGQGLIDLADQVLQELQTKSDEHIIAYRQGRRWSQSWSRLKLPEDQGPRQIRAGGTYLVTGGLGGIGFVLAEFLAQRFQARLILTGRASIPAREDYDKVINEQGESALTRRIKRLRYLEEQGASVVYYQADINNRAEMQHVLEAAEAKMGQIDGVIHSAGLADLGLIIRKTPASAEHIMAPKIRGTRILSDYFMSRQLDFFLLCSSLSSAIGGHGQVAYVAANTFLDAFAVQNAKRNFVSLNWDGWKEVGMAVSFAQAAARLQKRSDVLDSQAEELRLRGISNLEGVLAFERVVGSGLPHVAVATHDLVERVQQSWAPVEHVAVVNEDVELSTYSYPRPELSSPFREPTTDLEAWMAKDWRHILGMEKVGVDDDFFELGGDSLKGMNVVNALEKKFGEQFHIEALFDMSTIAQLCRYLEAEYAEAVAKLLGTNPSSAATAERQATAPLTKGEISAFKSLIPKMKQVQTDRAKNRRAVFVLAPPRSGSTLLRVMLAGNSSLVAPPELFLLNYATVREREAAFEGQTVFWKDGLIQVLMLVKDCSEPHARSIVEEFAEKNLSIKDLYHYLQDQIAALGGPRLLVDKTPDYAYSLETLACAERDFHEPLYIHLTRHPLGMIQSYKQAQMDIPLRHHLKLQLPYTSQQMAELLWAVCHENISTFLKGIPANRQKHLCFEELVKQPEVQMHELCSFLGVPFEADMLQPYKEKHRRMTEGINHDSRMLGDAKFHGFQKIEASVADAWRDTMTEASLGQETWALAETLGYHPAGQAPVQTVASAAEDLFANVDEMSEADIDAALKLLAEGN